MSHLTQSDSDLGHFEARWALGALFTFLELFLSSTSSPAGGPMSRGCDSAMRGVLGLCGLCPVDPGFASRLLTCSETINVINFSCQWL